MLNNASDWCNGFKAGAHSLHLILQVQPSMSHGSLQLSPSGKCHAHVLALPTKLHAKAHCGGLSGCLMFEHMSLIN